MNCYDERINLLYELPIVELLDLWYNRKIGKYAVRCLMGDRNETVLWMTPHQFGSFRKQCLLCGRNDSLYARYYGLNFAFTVFGAPVKGADYRLILCFDLSKKILQRPVPPLLEVPEHVQIDDTLLDCDQD